LNENTPIGVYQLSEVFGLVGSTNEHPGVNTIAEEYAAYEELCGTRSCRDWHSDYGNIWTIETTVSPR